MDFLYNGLLFCVLQDTCSYFLERMALAFFFLERKKNKEYLY